ncbi:MAG: hypothetical protein IKJ99_07435 [Oscillospiraceae bacterium]|nr:hypothetical protein [Oscillospiraceae bacterium]
MQCAFFTDSVKRQLRCGHHRFTHVLVNSPDTGYGIFIENMLDAAS